VGSGRPGGLEQEETERAAGRRRRADAGLVRVSPRDVELLRVVGEQYAVTVPQLARLMGRSEHAAVWLRKRWQRAGWVEGRALLVGRPVFVWPTRAGLEVAGLPYKPWAPSPGALAHVEAVTAVRLWLDARGHGWEWVPERELVREHGRQGHRPDALVLADGQQVPVEVELAQKKRERLEAIVRGHLAAHPTVWYFAAPAPKRVLDELAAGLGGERLQVLPLPAAR
jgi:hypothetical protein